MLTGKGGIEQGFKSAQAFSKGLGGNFEIARIMRGVCYLSPISKRRKKGKEKREKNYYGIPSGGKKHSRENVLKHLMKAFS